MRACWANNVHRIIAQLELLARGVEIAPEVADGAQSLILNQVEAGVAVRMAILYLLTGDSAERPGSKASGE